MLEHERQFAVGFRRTDGEEMISHDGHIYLSRNVDFPILRYLEEVVGWSGGRIGGLRVDGWMFRRMNEWLDA